MTTERWISDAVGQGLNWGNAFGEEINSASFHTGNSVLSSIQIANNTALALYCDLSFLAGAPVTTLAPAFLGFFLYPLGEDGATFGDGYMPTLQSAFAPPTNYAIGQIGFRQSTNTIIAGVLTGIIMPPGIFSFGLYNQSGVDLPVSGNVCKYRTYNLQVQ